MEITIKSQQNIVRIIVGKYNSGNPISIKDIVHTISPKYIHTIYKSYPALCAEKPADISQRDFFVVVQYCLFVHSLYRAGLIIIDKSHKNEPCNDYSNKDDYEFFSFQEVCGDEKLGRFICDNWSLSIIPTTDLIELVDKEFKTIEQLRHEEQLSEAKSSTCWSRFAAVIAVLAFIVSVIFGLVQSCSQQEIDSEQINTIISAIKEEKSISIDKFPDILPDTLNVKVTDTPEKQPINLNVTVKENQPTKIQ